MFVHWFVFIRHPAGSILFNLTAVGYLRAILMNFPFLHWNTDYNNFGKGFHIETKNKKLGNHLQNILQMM